MVQIIRKKDRAEWLRLYETYAHVYLNRGVTRLIIPREYDEDRFFKFFHNRMFVFESR